MSDKQTLAVYEKSADAYLTMVTTRQSKAEDRAFYYFVKNIPPSGHVLDLGCGPGHWAVKFQSKGFTVDALDASPAMAEIAHRKYGLSITTAAFASLDAEGIYDGIWANFSLLHIDRTTFKALLPRIRLALKPHGLFYVGLKTGKGETRDALGRYYCYYQPDELEILLKEVGLEVMDTQLGQGAGLSGEAAPFMLVTARA